MAARDHINMETYILDDDEVGQRFAQALIAKQRQGVQVNLIRDSVGTLGTPAGLLRAPDRQRHQVLEFNPVNPLVARKDWS
jgi:cardiolipin synthase A/B